VAQQRDVLRRGGHRQLELHAAAVHCGRSWVGEEAAAETVIVDRQGAEGSERARVAVNMRGELATRKSPSALALMRE